LFKKQSLKSCPILFGQKNKKMSQPWLIPGWLFLVIQFDHSFLIIA